MLCLKILILLCVTRAYNPFQHDEILDKSKFKEVADDNVVDCGGTIEVQLLNYDYLINGNNSSICCLVKGSGCDACYPVFEISLVELKDSTSSIIKTSHTEMYNDTNHIEFSSTNGPDAGHFIFGFTKFSSRFYLDFKIVDTNITLLDGVRFQVGQGEPSSFKSRTNYTVRTVTDNSNCRIKFEYIIKCKTYYYRSCQVYCKPVPKQYSCDNIGRKICEQGWSGPNCSIHQTGTSCKTSLCQNGATCVKTEANMSTCLCLSYYTGRLCELKLPSTSISRMSFSDKPGTTTTSELRSIKTILNHSRTVNSQVTSLPQTQSFQQATKTSTRLVLTAVTLTIEQFTFGRDTVKPDTSRDSTGIIVGSIVGALILLILVIITVCLCSNKWQQTKVNASVESPTQSEKK